MTKISALAAASALSGTELVPVVQSGVTERTTAQAIADLAPSGSSVESTSLFGGSESTASTSYTDLATSGPAVTVTTGTSVVVIPSAMISGDGTNVLGSMSVAVSGSTTIAAADNNAVTYQAYTAGGSGTVSSATVISGLTPGSNTFTCKYKTSASNSSFQRRNLTVIPL